MPSVPYKARGARPGVRRAARGRNLAVSVLFAVSSGGAAAALDPPPPVGGTWSELLPAGREAHSAVYDPVAHRVLVFGGRDGPAGAYRNDVLELNFGPAPAFTAFTTAGTPPSPRGDHGAVYDAGRRRMLVFGGSDANSFRSDVWALSLDATPTWSLVAAQGTAPAGRFAAGVTYDSQRDRLVVFGGAGSAGYLGDTWELLLAEPPTWAPISATGNPPSARYGCTATYDPVRDQVLVFGGADATSFNGRNDVLTLGFTPGPNWTTPAIQGELPGPRLFHCAAFDPIRDALLVQDGSDTWSLALDGAPQWTDLTPPGTITASARFKSAAALDLAEHRSIVVGGRWPVSRNDAWAVALDPAPAWQPLVVPFPPGRGGHVLVHDRLRNRAFVLDGDQGHVRGGGIKVLDDVWRFDLGPPVTVTQLAPTGGGPGPRSGLAGIYDPLRNRIVVFGGWDGVQVHDDAWVLDLESEPPHWSLLQAVGTPAWPREWHTAVLDDARDRMIVFGGRDGTQQFDDTWSLTFSPTPSWALVSTSGASPQARFAHTAVLDSRRDRMLVFAGDIGFSSQLHDTWALNLGTHAWSLVESGSLGPYGQSRHAAVYDRRRDRLVFWGHFVGALNLTGAPVWSLDPALEVSRPAGIYDAVLDRAVFFGGASFGVGDALRALTWGDPSTAAVPPERSGAALQVGPNPSRGPVRIALWVRQRGLARLAIFDVRGRLVRRFALTPGAERYEILWDGRDLHGARVGAGSYFVRLEMGGHTESHRVALVR